MDVQRLLNDIHELSDLELAVLLSLIVRGHCLISTEDVLIDDLASELALIVSERLGLSYVVLESDDCSNIETFNSAILEEKGTQFTSDYDDQQSGSLKARLDSLDIRAAPRPGDKDVADDSRMIKNVIIAKGFNSAHEHVQVQAIEIIENRRVLSHTTVHITPKTFLFIPLVTNSSRDVRLISHLNDRISISHSHAAGDGFANLEELDDTFECGSGHNRLSWESAQVDRRIGKETIDTIRDMSEKVTYTPEVRRYMQDIVTFMRMDRSVDGGITPRASANFVQLAKCLATLHGINFITPSLATLAARKVYPHRLILAEPARERSMQYGSDLKIIEELLDGITPWEAIENVLRLVPCPI
ncbi:hypothetical protein LTR66_014247 [Elasticomyces elasticus]|nr:hypothetical protein LTR66_014247 [Elasticomyces elasticus]